jgi:hypothetical protein
MTNLNMQMNSVFSDNARDFLNDDNFSDSIISKNKQPNNQTMTDKSLDTGLPAKASTHLKLQKCSTSSKAFGLSPITEISLGLEDTTLIGTPATGKLKTSEYNLINDK